MNEERSYPDSWLEAVQTLLQQRERASLQQWEQMQIVRDARAQALEQNIEPAVLLLEQAMAELENEDPLLAKTLRLRYWEGETLRGVSHRVHRSEASVHRDLRVGRERLAAILWRKETQAAERFRQEQLRRLESPTYERLFGVEKPLSELTKLVLDPSGPSILLLAGMGGIGKTSLADALCRELIGQRAFAAFGWVSLRPRVALWDARPFFDADSDALAIERLFEQLAGQLLGETAMTAPFSLKKLLARLRGHLSGMPHFIVIDNLETLNDAAPLLSHIRSLTPPSRFLVTSRRGHFSTPGVYHVRVQPLDRAASIALLRHEGGRRNVRILQEAEDADLSLIYDKVGGNPLALRLVAGQLHAHALHTVLDNLTQARGRSVTHLFEYIYRRSWANLRETERKALLAMPLLPPDGGSARQIMAITKLSHEQVHDALETLVQQNLVDYLPDSPSGRYAIHNLTRTFLQQQAEQWT